MPRITFVHTDGRRETIDAQTGISVMQAAVNNNVAGIVAQCGGSAMCATCHVFVDPGSIAFTGERGEIEEEMLDVTVTPRQASSRLSCQLAVTDEMDGLVVHLPDAQ